MHRSPKTIYQELRKQAEQDGITQEALSKTHNIKDIYRAYNAAEGKTSNAGTIQDAIQKKDSDEYIVGFALDTTIAPDYDLLGKVVSDLQKDVVIGDEFIKGTLHYIEDWEAFGDDNNDGWFLAVHVTLDEDTAALPGLSVKINGAELDPSDYIFIGHVKNQEGHLTLTVSATGKTPVTKTYTLKYLTYEPAEDETDNT